MDKFYEAMEWWKAQDNGGDAFNVYHMIRNLAVKRLEAEMCEGQGIGSSDINHTVYGIYCEWEAHKEWADKNDKYTSVCEFVVNEWAELV